MAAGRLAWATRRQQVLCLRLRRPGSGCRRGSRAEAGNCDGVCCAEATSFGGWGRGSVSALPVFEPR